MNFTVCFSNQLSSSGYNFALNLSICISLNRRFCFHESEVLAEQVILWLLKLSLSYTGFVLCFFFHFYLTFLQYPHKSMLAYDNLKPHFCQISLLFSFIFPRFKKDILYTLFNKQVGFFVSLLTYMASNTDFANIIVQP